MLNFIKIVYATSGYRTDQLDYDEQRICNLHVHVKRVIGKRKLRNIV